MEHSHQHLDKACWKCSCLGLIPSTSGPTGLGFYPCSISDVCGFFLTSHVILRWRITDLQDRLNTVNGFPLKAGGACTEYCYKQQRFELKIISLSWVSSSQHWEALLCNVSRSTHGCSVKPSKSFVYLFCGQCKQLMKESSQKYSEIFLKSQRGNILGFDRYEISVTATQLCSFI